MSKGSSIQKAKNEGADKHMQDRAHIMQTVRVMPSHSDFILPILQPNTGCFPIQKRPVFSNFCYIFPNLMIKLRFTTHFKWNRLYSKECHKITEAFETMTPFPHPQGIVGTLTFRPANPFYNEAPQCKDYV